MLYRPGQDIEPPASDDGSMLAQALAWSRRGFRVFPIEFGTKKPRIERYLLEATCDAAQIVVWWSKWPDANIGVALGQGVFVLDVDVKEGKPGLLSLAALGVKLDCTLCVRTPSGGYHLYFRSTEDYSNKAVKPGLDCKSAGGQVLAPPSYFNGGFYEVLHDVPLSPAPAALTACLTAAGDARPARQLVALDEPENVAAATLWLRYTAEPAVQGYNGNDRLYKTTAELVRDRAISPDLARQLLLEHWNPRCSPPWLDAEMKDFDKTFNSAVQGGKHDIGGKTQAGLFGDAVVAIPPPAGLMLPAPDSAAAGAAAGQGGDDDDTPLPVVRLGDLLETEAPAREFVVPGLIPDKTVTLFAGDGGQGKSTLAAQLAIAAATGTAWVGLEVKQTKCLILSAEDETAEFHYRAALFSAAARMGLGAEARERLNGVLFIDATDDVDPTLAVYDQRTTAVQTTPLFRRIKALVAREGIGLVIIDAAADVFAEELNRYAVRSFIRQLRTLGCAVVLLAHPSVEGMKSGRGYSGSTHWSNSVRSRLYLGPAETDDGMTPDPDLRVLTTKKANRGKTGEALTLRWTPQGFVRADLAAATLDDLALSQHADAVFIRLLRKFNLYGQRVSASPSANYAPTQFANHEAAEGVTQKAFTHAMHRLLAAARIAIVEDGPPSKRRRFLDLAATEVWQECAD